MPNTIFSIPIERSLFSCFFPHHVVTIHRFPPSNQDFRREKRFSDWRNDNEWNAAVGDQSAEERSGTSLRSPLCSRGISVAAKESFHSTLFPAPLSLSLCLSLYFVFRFLSSLFLLSFRLRRPLTAISVLPSWRTFFCRPTIITRDFSRFHPPPDRYLARQ